MALISTCYMSRNEPGIGEDFAAVNEHNNIPFTLAEKERCCGMPKLELGDLDAVVANKEIAGVEHAACQVECDIPENVRTSLVADLA
jgi:Fe-S oxidoreductase